MMIRSPKGGIRIGGRSFPSGMQIPEKYRRQLQSSRPADPGQGSTAGVPNLGRPPVPHVVTFSGMVTSLSKAYRNSDEALRHSEENAHAMLNDPVVSGPLFGRQMMTALLNWSIETEDDKDPKLKALAADLTDIMKRIPDFTEYRRSLMEAVWYGRCAIQHAYGFHTNRHGTKRRIIRKWTPVSGDKLLFRYDDGTGDFDPDQIGVRMSAAHSKHDIVAGDRHLEATGEGLGYFLQPWERKMWVLHKHMIRDGEFEDPISGGQIHGVGLRHFLYWVWYQKQETLAQIAELIDRTGMGFTIYFYPSGNESARQEVEKISKEQAHTNVILMPSEENDQYRVEQIPPNTQGLEVLRSVVEDFFGDMITRFILGQTLSSKSSSTGMNSGVADLQKDTLNHIIRYDAIKLEETITRDVLHHLRDINFPKYRNVDMWFRISTKSSAPQEELSAMMQLWQMGARIKTADIFDRLDLSMPDPDDQQLFNPQIVMQIDQMEQQEGAPQDPMGGAPMGMPQDGDNDGMVGEGTEEFGEAGVPEQMDKEAEEEREKERVFGPIMHKKTDLRKDISDAAAYTDRNPSDSQREAGNYKKGRFWWNGLEIAIETPRGASRRPEWPKLSAHYGYIKLHESEADGDHLDVFIGPSPESDLVVVIDQVTKGGRFDEHKIVLACTSTKEAVELYKDSYSSGFKVGPVTTMTVEQFKFWLTDGSTKKPINAQVSRYRKYAKQLSLWDDDAHPRATEHVNIDGRTYESGQWVPKDKAAEATPKEQESIEMVDEETGETEPFEDTEQVETDSTPMDPGTKLKSGQAVHGYYSNGIDEVKFSGKVGSIHTDTAGGNFKTARITLDNPVTMSSTGERTVFTATLSDTSELHDSKFSSQSKMAEEIEESPEESMQLDKKGPAGLTKSEAMAKAMEGSNRNVASYDQAVHATYLYTGTSSSDWSSVPIKDFRDVDDGNGGQVSMPEFDFPSGYKQADVIFGNEGGNVGSGSCELCGHSIKNNYHIQNDKDKLTMQVGSECVTNFAEGESGAKLAKKAKAEMNRDMLRQVWTARDDLAKVWGDQNQKTGKWEIRKGQVYYKIAARDYQNEPKDKRFGGFENKDLERQVRQRSHEIEKLYQRIDKVASNSKGDPIPADDYENVTQRWHDNRSYGGGQGGWRTQTHKMEATADGVITRWAKARKDDVREVLEQVDEILGRSGTDERAAGDGEQDNTPEIPQKSAKQYAKDLDTERLSPLFDDGHLDQETIEHLRQIAGDFISGTEIPRDAVVDVQLTGSMSGYNWNNGSDIDLHIIVDPELLLAPPELLSDYFYNVSANWNARHSVTIGGHEVEVFVEPMKETIGDLLVVAT